MNKDRFFEIVDQIQERNKDRDPDEVYCDVTEAVEEVRQKLYGRGVVAATCHWSQEGHFVEAKVH